MHLICCPWRGTVERVEHCVEAWPMPKLQQSNDRWLRRDFRAQYAVGTTHGGRGGAVVKSFRVVECDEAIYRAAVAASGGADGWATDDGHYGVDPGGAFARAAKQWQRNRYREARP